MAAALELAAEDEVLLERAVLLVCVLLEEDAPALELAGVLLLCAEPLPPPPPPPQAFSSVARATRVESRSGD